ncbi:MAG: type II secretion system ATPase GspE [Planctomycetota bacterium]|jgi:general secretion pathway protein E|nr:type II secretion system ATPase GspE [Planctomycetota bacterium]
MIESIYQVLVDEGTVSSEGLASCVQEADEQNTPIEKVLIQKGVVSEKNLLDLHSRVLGFAYYETLENIAVPEEFLTQVPIVFARKFDLVGIGHEDGQMLVALSNPSDQQPLDDLASMVEQEIEPVLAPRTEIHSLINRAYESQRGLGDDIDLEDEALGLSAEIEASEDILESMNKAPIVKFVNNVLFQALKRRASDIHLQPLEDRLVCRYRIDGTLYEVLEAPKKAQDAIISRIKVMGKMDIAERRLPQDGRASIRLGDREVDLRISSVPTNHGERIVFRILDKGSRTFSLDEIGLSEDHMETLRTYLRYNHGIIFVTGPTGSGKTTTLYACLARINSPDKNIMTIEDPIEYHLGGISQIQVNQKAGLTFASGLRSLLRQDPDIMMVGEVRDEETARIAIQSSLTGHLVFSTVHTNDSAGAVTRLIDIGIEPYLVSSSLVLSIAQRLVRRICDHCKEAYIPTQDELVDLGIEKDDLPEGGKLWHGRGCEKCLQTGYSGRTAIYEILPITEAVRQLIMRRASGSEIKQKALESDLITLRMDGVTKVLCGFTTAEEVLSTTQRDLF